MRTEQHEVLRHRRSRLIWEWNTFPARRAVQASEPLCVSVRSFHNPRRRVLTEAWIGPSAFRRLQGVAAGEFSAHDLSVHQSGYGHFRFLVHHEFFGPQFPEDRLVRPFSDCLYAASLVVEGVQDQLQLACEDVPLPDSLW